MAYLFHVRPHPLGVVVSKQPNQLGELLIPGEDCCGVGYEELARVAATTGYIEIPDAATKNLPGSCR